MSDAQQNGASSSLHFVVRESFLEERWFLSSKLVARLVTGWATCEVKRATLSRNKVEREVDQLICCVSDIGNEKYDNTVLPQFALSVR